MQPLATTFTASPVVELARQGATQALLALWKDYQLFYEISPGEIDEERNRRHIEYIIAHPERGHIFLLRLNENVIGFGTIYYSFSSTAASLLGVINDLFVSEPFRNRGFGRQLLRHCLDFLQGNGIAIAEWATLPNNRRAQAMYDRFAEPALWCVYRVTLIRPETRRL